VRPHARARGPDRRKPYRSLAADVITILQDRLHLLLRGEVVWQKGDGASGSCAWGSFRKASNPVLRDITERVVIASKGRFARAKDVKDRAALGLPHHSTPTADEFMAATLDVWEIPPESARRVNHPAPFPVELPARLIELYTYEDDLVLDPFMGSGSTLVAAARLDRRYVGYDLDRSYVALARRRVADAEREKAAPADNGPARNGSARSAASATAGKAKADRPAKRTTKRTTKRTAKAPIEETFPADGRRDGKAAVAVAEDLLAAVGFAVAARNARQRGTGVTVNYVAHDADGCPWYFDVCGTFTTTRGGLHRTDMAWKSVGRAHVLAARGIGPLVLLTTHLPKARSEADTALRAAGPAAFFDAIEMLATPDVRRLASYAGGGVEHPVPGFWSAKELAGGRPPGVKGAGA
jgi:DNA methylase